MESIINTKDEKVFIDSLKDIVKSARKNACSSICFAQVQSNWLLGRLIEENKKAGIACYIKLDSLLTPYENKRQEHSRLVYERGIRANVEL